MSEVIRYEVFARAAALVRQGWLKKALATDTRGRQVFFGDPAAVNFDACGAIENAAGDMAFPERAQADYYAGQLFGMTLTEFNDAAVDVQAVANFLEWMATAPYVNPYPLKCDPYEPCT